ncbi:hypothetical protein BDV96DRAFT_652396 [Lophiotrema nucula]|uniref:Uncharacterized protein n=1 Tax=Lophiotrema nucula TaxID=690887 RepID=A0A6A5YRJ5_9PLEO|nr:hypothetical protein BDV96DRAFT_652396 [Lophiotrema nucula]
MVPTLHSSSPTNQKLILSLAIALPLIVVLAVVMGVVHCILKRHRKKLEARTRPVADVEAARPTLPSIPEATVMPTVYTPYPQRPGASEPRGPYINHRRTLSADHGYVPPRLSRSVSATAHMHASRTMSSYPNNAVPPIPSDLQPLAYSLSRPVLQIPRPLSPLQRHPVNAPPIYDYVTSRPLSRSFSATDHVIPSRSASMTEANFSKPLPAVPGLQVRNV